MVENFSNFGLCLAGVERNNDRPHLPRRMQCRNGRCAIFDQQQNTVSGLHTRSAQFRREVVAGAVKVAVAPFHTTGIAQRSAVGSDRNAVFQKFFNPCHAPCSCSAVIRAAFFQKCCDAFGSLGRTSGMAHRITLMVQLLCLTRVIGGCDHLANGCLCITWASAETVGVAVRAPDAQ